MEKATRQHTKAHNQRLILNKIYHTPKISRAGVARMTGLTRSTVSENVSELILEGLVAEIGHGKSAGGKPPILLNVVDQARQIIGIDLASGEFRGAIVNLRGAIQHRINLPVENRSGEMAFELVYNIIDQLVAKVDTPLLGIGIGTPGLIDAGSGVVQNAVNLDWQNLAVADILKERYQLPVFIANDSQLSALAEYNFGESHRVPNLMLIKIGRGVGAGVILNQQLHYGDSFGAGEIGHIKVEENGELCRCGNYGCLETRLSSRYIRRKSKELALKNNESLLSQFAATQKEISNEVILKAYQDGDPGVQTIVKEVGTRLGKALTYLVSLLDINRIVIAGSVSLFGDGLITPAIQELKAGTLSALSNNIEVHASSLGEDIVILGSAGMVLQNELGIF
jgi:glucokinase-like ROK family protein